MLIEQTREGNKVLELHHLGKLSLNVQIRNPLPKEEIPNWERDVDFGPIHFDAFFMRKIEHDFYYTYEIIKGKKNVIEKVSFTKPIKFLNNKNTRLIAMLSGLIPNQHPAVTDYDYDSELAGFNIPTGSENFYGWEYRKTISKLSVKREVHDGIYDSLIPEHLVGKVNLFIPSDLFGPLYKSAPLYVLEVLDMVDFGFFDAVLPGYHEHFRPRLSQRLLL